MPFSTRVIRKKDFLITCCRLQLAAPAKMCFSPWTLRRVVKPPLRNQNGPHRRSLHGAPVIALNV